MNLTQTILKTGKKLYLTINKKRAFTKKYTFENRSESNENLCIILAGYKEFTWEIIFERINKYSDKNIDICIVSSGLYSEKLSNIAKKYGWSYLSTKKNNVCLAQNVAINLFKKAKHIFKLDEDIFVTKDFFKTLKNTYETVQEKGKYNVGFVAPLIPINGYSHVILLKKLELISYYEKTFEQVKYSADNDRMIVNNTDVAKLMWGENNKIPHIDELNKKLLESEFSYSAAPIKFSIGAIYFKREFWKDMNYFRVIPGSGMGIDENQICTYCMKHSKAIIISENTCVGHLSFGPQNKEMEQYFKDHLNKFEIKKTI